MHLWLRLGIIQVNLASALALHNRSIKRTFLAHDFFAHEFHEFTRNMLNYINGDLIGRTNFH